MKSYVSSSNSSTVYTAAGSLPPSITPTKGLSPGSGIALCDTRLDRFRNSPAMSILQWCPGRSNPTERFDDPAAGVRSTANNQARQPSGRTRKHLQ